MTKIPIILNGTRIQLGADWLKQCSRFMDKHLIYRKIDRSDFKLKVYKMEGEKPGLPDVDSVEGAAKGDIYMVQDMEDTNKPINGRVNKII